MPLNVVDSEALRMTIPLLVVDGNPEELVTALFNVIFDQKDKIIITQLGTSVEKISKFVDIYIHKATRLRPLKNALIEYAAQPHVARCLEDNRTFIINRQQNLQQRTVNSDLVSLLKECYIDDFSFFKPLSFDELTFKLDYVWINLQLENTADLTTVKVLDCIDCINAAFHKRKVVICKAGPGTGKSTLSKYLCYKWAKGEWKDCQFDLVFLVPVREIVGKKSSTIIEAVINIAKSYDILSEKLDCIEKIVKSCKTLVILDGYDEATGACHQIRSVIFNETKCLPFCVLLTSRPWAIADIKCPAQVVNICPLSSDQRSKYVANHFFAIGKPNLGQRLITDYGAEH